MIDKFAERGLRSLAVAYQVPGFLLSLLLLVKYVSMFARHIVNYNESIC